VLAGSDYYRKTAPDRPKKMIGYYRDQNNPWWNGENTVYRFLPIGKKNHWWNARINYDVHTYCI